MTTLLSLSGVRKSFGALVVADDVTFELPKGRALGIIGPNGAGKSTLFNLIGGALAPSAGTVRFKGEDITGTTAAARCHAGIARSFQIPHPFVGMSVYENLLTAARFGGSGFDDPTGACRDILSRTGLLAKANRPAGSLTLLERKRLELARALATGPELLLLDEIAGGLTEAECHDLVALIRDIHASGVTIIWIEHIVHALLAVVDHLMVIDFGKIVASGDPTSVMADPMVQEIYMGISVDDAA
ncbi:MAG: ABC transporter ATP-binding protein [Rhodobacterales bacterium]|uniref:ABC transporter ATP-binding protein n=1 Tax=Sulfitobacter sp. HI0054 TaxID=1822238 RepID=UPI0007C26137|nr:ABC transporter ATP-binding protein [Sulfitobacter sp. HI0054]KZY53194.1 ABC transporter ATP-binding protein [Sulfitobacter sp. HI0054]MDX5411439.1 ABC transporter ATP-binding protein [Rhodobacterales bacterium]